MNIDKIATNEVPDDPKWRQERVEQMVKEMGEHGINGTVSIGIGKNNHWWSVALYDFDSNENLTQHISINCCHENGYEMVQAAYLATINCRG